ncbi:MAG TPA: Na+/H+ antiporter subunit E [Planctomycetota bacterium]|nr:Na+/H+ antiporter subunit E [Planctomycetota bacterium]
MVWLLMSGHYEPLLLGMGVLSVALVVWLSARMGVVDREGLPLQHARGLYNYVPWLLKEVVVSSWAVARRIVAPKLKVEPQVFVVDGFHGDDVAQTLYANSITLTPGTLTMDVGDDSILIHALSNEATQDLQTGAMRSRLARTKKEAN